MPNCLVPVSNDLRIISLYRGSNTCSGQGIVGNAMVQTKMGTSWFKLKQKEYTHEQQTKKKKKITTQITNTYVMIFSTAYITTVPHLKSGCRNVRTNFQKELGKQRNNKIG